MTRQPQNGHTQLRCYSEGALGMATAMTGPLPDVRGQCQGKLGKGTQNAISVLRMRSEGMMKKIRANSSGRAKARLAWLRRCSWKHH